MCYYGSNCPWAPISVSIDVIYGQASWLSVSSDHGGAGGQRAGHSGPLPATAESEPQESDEGSQAVRSIQQEEERLSRQGAKTRRGSVWGR